MPSNDIHSHDDKAGRKRRWLGSALMAIGYILSPLSWWNDMVVNVPLAYALSWPVAIMHDRLFLPAFVITYWLTNLLGLVLLHIGFTGLVGHDSNRWHRSGKRLRYHIAVSLFYTLIIVLFVWLEWIPSPEQLLQNFSTTT